MTTTADSPQDGGMTHDKQSGAELEICPAFITDKLLDDLITAVLAHTEVGFPEAAPVPHELRMHRPAVKADMVNALTRSLPQAGDSKCVECGSLGGTLGNSHIAGCSHIPQAGEPALCEHGHIDRMSGCNQCEAREIEGTDSPQAGEGVERALQKVRDVVQAFPKFSDDKEFGYGLNLGDLRAIAALPPAGRVEELEAKLRMIISHASGGRLSEPGDTDRSINDICVEISRHKNEIWEQAKESALTGKAHP